MASGADIRKREKRTNELLKTGLTEKQARQQAKKEIREVKEEKIVNPNEEKIASLREKIKSDPSQFGLQKPGEEIQTTTPENIEVQTTPGSQQSQELTAEQRAYLKKQLGYGEGEVSAYVEGKGLVQLTDEELIAQANQKGGDVMQLLGTIAGVLPGIGLGSRIALSAEAAGAVGVAEGEAVTASKAVQLANAAKNSIAAKGPLKILRDASLSMFGLLGSIKYGADFFTRKVDDQQQALNTLGQITSTIVGDSTTGAGDWKKGLDELQHIKKEIVYLEQAIKAGTIKEATLKFNGQVIDLNADIYDQLSTIDEGIRDLQSFALSGQFPELSEFELQEQLRRLEEEGYIQAVDLTKSRRATDGSS